MAKKTAKKQGNNGNTGQAAIRRAQTEIAAILEREKLVMTASRVRVLFKGKDGSTSGGDLLTLATLSKLRCQLTPETVLFPQVELEVSRAPQPKPNA